MTRPTRHLRQRLQGLVATVLLLGLVIGFPVVLIAIGAAPSDAELDELRTLLTRADDGTLAVVVFAGAAWIAWAVVAASVLIETASRIRGLPAPSIPGLALPQRAAGQLVAVAALLFVAAPSMAAAFPPALAHAAPAPPVPESARPEVLAQAAPVQGETRTASPTPAPKKHDQASIDYTVKRGDSLWKIAERLLGDGARYTEIVDLNRALLNGRPDFIVSGTVLRVPHELTEPDEDGGTAEEYVVEPGDTLSRIAEEKLGYSNRYPEIFKASQATVQPDGGHLTDPNLIRPGWELTIPDPAPVRGDPGMPPIEPPTDGEPPVDPPVKPPVARPTPEPTTVPTAEPTPSPNATDPATTDDTDNAEKDSSPGWLLPGFTGAGAVLAGSLLLAIRAQRRTRQRHRRPGRTIAPPPRELRAVEKTATVVGAATAEMIDQLARLLSHLASATATLPRVDAVEVDRRSATLHLNEPADLPEPWQKQPETPDTKWTAPLDAQVGDEDQLAPYPMLASVGQDDAGHLWFLDLEHLGSTTLTGDAGHAYALARHIAAELTLNPWAVLVEIDTIEVASELTTLDTLRLHYHPADDTEFLIRLRKDVDVAQQAGFGEPEPFHALLLAGNTRTSDDVRQLVEILQHREQRTRPGLAVLALDTPREPDDVVAELTPDGRLRVPHLGLDVAAAGLSASEATACAAIVDLTRNSEIVPVPVDEEATGWRALADHAGALRAEFTLPRPAGPTGDTSLLPDGAQRYETVAATTADDVEGLAPLISEQTRGMTEDADPNLDADLTHWHDPESPNPKLTLLGSVAAAVRGAVPAAVAERKAYFVELLAFLALHPDGVTTGAVTDAFSISASRARTDLGFIRSWLGTNPHTGRPHLPAANASRVYERTGVSGYQLDDVLVDLDLFRRLRTRGEARGADGLSDLEAALRLASGLPFDHLREQGWSWLLDGERLHETAALAIVDTAHIVVVDALSKSDFARARAAAETACRAAPYDEVCRLDLAKVAEAEGHDDLAEQILNTHVFNRSDDQLPPIDLPGRTRDVVRNHGWGRPGRRPEDG